MRPAGKALVTGASGGIGRELAAVFAEHGHDVVLVARRRDRLEAIASELTARYGIVATPVCADLGTREGIAAVLRVDNVDILVSNAGRGMYSAFSDGTPEDAESLIRLNVQAPTIIAHHFVKPMIERRRGWILNIVSTAAFKPGPMMAVYNAAKAYQLFLSEALANEVADAGVVVTAVCPGATRTDFARNAGIDDAQLPTYKRIPSPREVAEFAYEALSKKQVVAVHGLANRAITTALRFMPRSLVAAANRKSREVHK
jgi:short-subunit dehydrogenase